MSIGFTIDGSFQSQKVSMTFSLINNAREIFLTLTGAGNDVCCLKGVRNMKC